MSAPGDLTEDLQDTVRGAISAGEPQVIRGGGTKSFLGRRTNGKELDVDGHRGILNYEPTELVISARGGTPLKEVETSLHEHGQMLAFEPPHFGPNATLGGTLAAGVSGPRRPYAGAARDFVLGAQVLNGRAEVLRFGGEVMKNVAGYDLSRLMVGAFGTLGIVLEASLKVLPQPTEECTLSKQCTAENALEQINQWAAKPFPLSGTCFDGGVLYLRLSGSSAAVRAARTEIGGDVVSDGPRYWETLREHEHPFFQDSKPLWRVAVPRETPPLPLAGKWLLDWGGTQRWLLSEQDADTIRRVASQAGGHATLFRGSKGTEEVFQPLSAGLLRLHRNLKSAFDPHGIMNPGRMYQEL